MKKEKQKKMKQKGREAEKTAFVNKLFKLSCEISPFRVESL